MGTNSIIEVKVWPQVPVANVFATDRGRSVMEWGLAVGEDTPAEQVGKELHGFIEGVLLACGFRLVSPSGRLDVERVER